MSTSHEADRIIARWEWRMIHSPQGAIALPTQGAPDADRQIAALGEQAMEEMKAAHQAARAEPARRVQEAEARVADLERQLRSLGASEDSAVITPRRDMLPRITTLLSFLLTAAVATAAAFAAGAFLGLTATSSYVPAIAVVVLAAVLGGIAGDALTRVRTPWAIGVAAGATGLGAIAAYLVAWVAGLSAERRLLLAILFLITALVAAAIWAITSFARRPRSEDAQQVAVARRVAGLGEARGELRVVRAELEALDGEWGVRVVEVEAVCVRARFGGSSALGIPDRVNA
jgi:hypothetical protein